MINRILNSCLGMSSSQMGQTFSSIGRLCFSVFQNQNIGGLAFGVSTLVGRNLIPGVCKSLISSIFPNFEKAKGAISDLKNAFFEAYGTLERTRRLLGFQSAPSNDPNTVERTVTQVQTATRVIQTVARRVDEVRAVAEEVIQVTRHGFYEAPGFMGTCATLLGAVALRQTRDVARMASISFQVLVIAMVAAVFYAIVQVMDKRRIRSSEFAE